MRNLQLLFFFVVTATIYGQVGVAGFYNINSVSSGSNDSQIDVPYDNGYEVAINYWFRLPKKRVEFLSTLYYASGGDNLNASEFGFQFKTNFYIFDFGTDCDCPTFGKQGPQLQKGFFVQLSPGFASYHQEFAGGMVESNNLALTLGGALGVDIGITNLLTLTPIVGLRYSLTDISDIEYTDEQGTPTETDASVRLTTIQLGLQATFRFDKKRY